MAIEVKIPTILRTHTGGSKTVEGNGDTLAALVDDLLALRQDLPLAVAAVGIQPQTQACGRGSLPSDSQDCSTR